MTEASSLLAGRGTQSPCACPADGGVVACFGGKCTRLPEYSQSDLAVGPPTMLDAVVVERVRRLQR